MNSLPINLLCYISQFLEIKLILKFGLCSKHLSKILNNELLWKNIAVREFGKEILSDNVDNKTWKEIVREGDLIWEPKLLPPKRSPSHQFMVKRSINS